MSVLASIRNRAGLLVTVIGVALLIFILQAALESGKWFSNDRNVGEIAGKGVPIEEFDYRVKQQLENYKRNQQQSTVDPGMEDQFVQQTWTQMINEIVMNKEYEKLGLSVSEDELYDLMLVHPHKYVIQQFSERESGKINKDFLDPATGQIDVKKLNTLVQQMNEQQEAAWSDLEKAVKEDRISEKYNNLIKKGLYYTKLEAKQEYVAQNKQFKIKYIVKKYNSLADSVVKVIDADLTAYYNEHQNEYKQEEETRKIEYITYEVFPTKEDTEAIYSDMKRIADEFKTRARTEDSAYVISESDSRNFDVTYHKKGTLSPEIDSLMFFGEKGFVYGPYLENSMYKVAKLVDSKMAADSAKVRHILIALEPQTKPGLKREKARAKAMADSLTTLIKEKKRTFEDLVREVSEDPGSIEKGGDYGWFNSGSGFVEPFKNAGLIGQKGDITVVETQFGYHIIEVLDRSKGESKLVQVATIDKKIEPSPKTIQSYYTKAGEFAGKNRTLEAFTKAVEEQKINKRVAEDVKEGDKNIPGLESPRELVRWMYNEKTKKGDVSDAFELGNKFVVAVLTEIRPKGIPPMELVRELVEPKAKERKKAEKFIEDYNKILSREKNFDNVAILCDLQSRDMEDLTFNTTSLPGAGKEDDFVGTVVTMKAGTISKPIVGRSGVYVVKLESIKEAPETKDYSNIASQTVSTMQSRVDYEVFEALKDNAEIVDKKAKFY
ncbi:MAG: SurA N-terminal domain-containing protein [Bacteroidetes bacterium]|nr:SurA N-terminal domain-containing protein [Bacteroidota bacterium]